MLPSVRPAPQPSAALHPVEVLSRWLSTAAEDDLQPRLLRLADGRLVPLPVARWSGPVSQADESMLARATGPVLDVGCGPGRLTAALHQRGVEVLGLELVPELPVLARLAGAPLLLGDVFAPVPRAGSWRTVLLADGNVGIGGDAVRMLRRVRGLLAPDGQVVCELHPGADSSSGPVRLEGLGVTSAWFPWALLGTAALDDTAGAAGLAVQTTWETGGRTFATLTAL
ncbi:MAG: methyltransferase type 12 [Frankiales bacterium]|nr:methyltransferase type 12 [Frankiales bacterium]